MSVQSVCLGWHWQPYAYSRTADDTDGAPVKPLPASLLELGARAVLDAFGPASALARGYAPDAAIVNLYEPRAHLGLHQDGEEPSDAPVVTISLGDRACSAWPASIGAPVPSPTSSCARATCSCSVAPTVGSTTASPRCSTGTAPEGLGLPPGRLSITVRETGLPG